MIIDAISAGLKCDGVTNDTAALQAVIATEAKKRSVTINFPDGADVIIGGLQIGDGKNAQKSSYHNVRLVGHGPGSVWGTEMDVDSSNTRFLYPADGPQGGAIVQFCGPIFGCGIEGIRFEGRGRARSLWVTSLTEGVFEQIACLNAPVDNYAIVLDGVGTMANATMRCIFRDLYVWGGSGGIRVGDILTASECPSNRFENIEIAGLGYGHNHGVCLELGDSNTFSRLNTGPLGGLDIVSITVSGGVATLVTKDPHRMTYVDGIFLRSGGLLPIALCGNFDATPQGPTTITFPVPGCPNGSYQTTFQLHCSGLQLRRAWQTVIHGFVSDIGARWTEPDPQYLIDHGCGGFLAGEGDGNFISGLMVQELGGPTHLKPGRMTILTTSGELYNTRSITSEVVAPPVDPISPHELVNGDFSAGLQGWTAVGNWAVSAGRVLGSTPQGNLYQVLPAIAGKAYTLTGKLLAAGANKPAAIGLRFMDMTGKELALPMHWLQPGVGQDSLTYTAPAGAYTMWVMACALDAGMSQGAWQAVSCALS